MRISVLRTITLVVLNSMTVSAADPSTNDHAACYVEPTPPFPNHGGYSVVRLKLLHYVAPEYPALARTSRVQGQVLLAAKITENGEVRNLEIISAHPIFVSAVLAAVKQWRYQPACLKGVPVTVDYTIVINFSLKDGVKVS